MENQRSMEKLFFVGLVLLNFLVTTAHSAFQDSPPGDIVAVDGQRIELVWKFPQDEHENMKVSFTKHGNFGVPEYQILKCPIYMPNMGISCTIGIGLVTIVIGRVSVQHEGRYDFAISNGFREQKYFNLHVVGLKLTVHTENGNVISVGNISEETKGYEYNRVPYHEINLYTGQEYAFKISTDQGANISCWEVIKNEPTSLTTRLDTDGEFFYHHYSSARFINQKLRLECDLGVIEDVKALNLQVKIFTHKDPEQEREIYNMIPVFHQHLSGFIYGSGGFQIVMSVLTLGACLFVCWRVRNKHYTLVARTEDANLETNAQDVLTMMKALKEKLDGTLDVNWGTTAEQLLTAMTALTTNINEFAHLKTPESTRALAWISAQMVPRPRLQSVKDKPEEGAAEHTSTE